MGKIELKSGKIVKIELNRAKTRFHTRFYAFGTKQQLCAIVPSSSRCQTRIGYYTIHTTYSHTQNKSKQLTRSFFNLHLSSSTFTQHSRGKNQNPQVNNSFLHPYSPSLSRPSSNNQPPVHHQQPSFSPAIVRSRFQTTTAAALQWSSLHQPS